MEFIKAFAENPFALFILVLFLAGIYLVICAGMGKFVYIRDKKVQGVGTKLETIVRVILGILGVAMIVVSIVLIVNLSPPGPKPTPTPTATLTQQPTASYTATVEDTVTPSVTVSLTSTPTETVTPTSTPTLTPTSTLTATATEQPCNFASQMPLVLDETFVDDRNAWVNTALMLNQTKVMSANVDVIGGVLQASLSCPSSEDHYNCPYDLVVPVNALKDFQLSFDILLDNYQKATGLGVAVWYRYAISEFYEIYIHNDASYKFGIRYNKPLTYIKQGLMPEIYHLQPREVNKITVGVKDFTSCLVINDQYVDGIEDGNINHNGNIILRLYLSSGDSIMVRMDNLKVYGTP